MLNFLVVTAKARVLRPPYKLEFENYEDHNI
jgi:hypothetical protein